MQTWNSVASRGVSLAVSAATAVMALQPWRATQLIVIKIIGGGEMRVIDIYGDIIVLRHGYTNQQHSWLSSFLSLHCFLSSDGSTEMEIVLRLKSLARRKVKTSLFISY